MDWPAQSDLNPVELFPPIHISALQMHFNLSKFQNIIQLDTIKHITR